jgi:dihydrofolate reductase
MKLTTITNISVDGVIQGGGGPDEDRRDGFERGGWTTPFFDTETAEFTGQKYRYADAFLLGRWTFEVFANYWGKMSPDSNPIAAGLNTRPKYVASDTMTDPGWSNSTVISSDNLASTIAKLKAQTGDELLVPGGGLLHRWLQANRLVDEMTLLIYPVVVGQGTRLFPAAGVDTSLELVESRSTPKGVTIQTYRPIGQPDYATGSPDPVD